MLQKIRNLIFNKLLKRGRGSQKGQAAIVLILVIAISLIFYAASLNFGDIASIKGLTTTSSNAGASLLASYMSSYGEQASQSELNGQLQYCDHTDVLAAIIIIIIIIVIIIFPALGAVLGSVATAMTSVYVISLAVAALVLQLAVVQPGITKAWNRMVQKTLGPQEQFTENALQNSLRAVVTDSVQVPDMTDMDNDRVWVENVGDTPYNDTVGRFGVYYMNRLRNLKEIDTAVVENFLIELKGLLLEEGDGWGVHDHLAPDDCYGSAECHPCCVPQSIEAGGEIVGVGPADCYKPVPPLDEVPNWEASCASASPYGADHPWVYDPAYENPNNEFYSLRELIGRDDEHKDYAKNFNDPNFEWPSASDEPEEQIPVKDLEHKYYLQDTTNFYVPPHYTPAYPENRKGIFPFFYKIKDWNVDLSAIDTSGLGCHWCDERFCGDCTDSVSDGPFGQYPIELNQLVLPNDPATLNVNTHVVDASTDSVGLPTNILTESDQCAQGGTWRSEGGFWKEGSDRFCSTTWPYNLECAKHLSSNACSTDDILAGDENCACGEQGADPTLSADDTIDDLYHGLSDFILWAEQLLRQGDADLLRLTLNLPLWFADAERWIVPIPRVDIPDYSDYFDDPDGSDDPPVVAIPTIILRDSETGEPKDVGYLQLWILEMTEIKNRLIQWIENRERTFDAEGNPVDTPRIEGEGYFGVDCYDKWCMPDDTDIAIPACPLIKNDERATFGEGTIDDVIACLDHNSKDYELNDLDGNAERFQACFDACSACQADDSFCTEDVNKVCVEKDLSCAGVDPCPLECSEDCSPSSANVYNTYLPRSLVPGFDPSEEYLPVSIGVADLKACPENCLADLAECTATYDAAVIVCDATQAECMVPIDETLVGCLAASAGLHFECTSASNALHVECLTTNFNTYNDICMPGCLGDALCESNCLTTKNNEDTFCTEASSERVILCMSQKTANDDLCNSQKSDDELVCQEARDACVAAGSDAFVICGGGFTCEGLNCLNDVLSVTTTTYADAVVAAKGSCDEDATVEGSFLNLLEQSIPDAENQVVKFAHRRDFLQARLDEAQGIIDILDTAIIKFQAFLDGPAADLIRYVDEFDPNIDGGLPYQAVYGWQSEPKEPGGRGKWHIVKVEARLPGNCDGGCGTGNNPYEKWPAIKTFVKNFATKRCYKLIFTEGIVKFRTTRYDEGGGSKSILFPNGEPIWKIRSGHSRNIEGLTPLNPSDLSRRCIDNSTILSHPDGQLTDIYKGAFMMNEKTSDNASCWDHAHRFLSRGIVSETCAEYFWDPEPEAIIAGEDAELKHEGRMNFKFISCGNF